ncbi:MAG: SNF2-related protein [Oceanipulchritudo sp.]
MNHESFVQHLPESYSGFRLLTAAAFWNLAERAFLERGLRYFERGVVHDLVAFSKKPGWLVAKVRGGRIYTVLLGIEGNQLLHDCDCPAYTESGACKHVAAVVLLALDLFTGRRIGHGGPDDHELEERRIHLLGSMGIHPESADEGEPEIRLEPVPWGDFQFMVTGRKAVALLDGCGLGRGPYSPKKTGRAYPVAKDQLGPLLAEIVPAARKAGVRAYWTDAEGTTCELPSRHGPIEGRHFLHLNTDDEWIMAIGNVPVEEEAVRAVLPDGRVITDDDTLLSVYFPKDDRLVRMARSHVHIAAHNREVIPSLFYRAEENGCPVDEWNARALAVPLNLRQGKIDGTVLFRGLNVVGWDALPPADPLLGWIRVDGLPGRGRPGTAETGIDCGGQSLPLWDYLLPCLQHDLLAEDIDRRLLAAKGRFSVLMDAARALLLSPSKKDRERIVRDASVDSVFARLRLKNKAIRWLRRFERNWAAPAEGKHLMAMGDPEPQWVLMDSPARLFAGLLLFGNTLPDRKSILNLGDELLPGSLAGSADLRRLALAARALGAAFSVSGKATRLAPVTFSLDVAESKDIDWFELKPELRCEELTLSADEWRRLISGDLLLEDADGFILPDLGQAEAAEAIRRILVSKSREGKKGKAWSIPRLQILDWIELRKQGVTVRLPPEAEAIFTRLQDLRDIPQRPVPKALSARLRDYQKRGFDWLAFLYENRFGACLADDMGLGKTVQAITFLLWLKERKRHVSKAPHLVLVPPTLLFNWHHEIETFADSLVVCEYHGNTRDREAFGKADLVLTTYDILRRDIALLETIPFDVLLLDETQALKNIKAARTAAVRRVQRRFTVCLTGTPLENHIGEYYSILELALPGIFGDYAAFMKTAREGGSGLLNRARPFVLRRRKAEILTELPPKQESDVRLEMTREQKEIYTRTVGEVREEVMTAFKEKTRSQAGIVALAALLRLRQVCVSPELLGKSVREPVPKLTYLLDKLRELKEEDQCALVFSQFTRTLDLVGKMAADAGLPVLRLDGSVPAARRKELVRTFQSSREPLFFLISLRAGGVGLNLTRAQTVFHVDPWWNPAVENQASDRAHRIGQTQTVFIQRLIMRHSVEEKIMLLKARKQKLFDAVLGQTAGRRTSAGMVSREDFDFLLS